MSKVYFGERDWQGARVGVRFGVSDGISLPMRFDLRNHSPSGPEWGYSGSGPAQLALAILADACGDAVALVLYQRFKAARVAGFAKEAWSMKEADVQDWVMLALREDPALQQRLDQTRQDLVVEAEQRREERGEC